MPCQKSQTSLKGQNTHHAHRSVTSHNPNTSASPMALGPLVHGDLTRCLGPGDDHVQPVGLYPCCCGDRSPALIARPGLAFRGNPRSIHAPPPHHHPPPAPSHPHPASPPL